MTDITVFNNNFGAINAQISLSNCFGSCRHIINISRKFHPEQHWGEPNTFLPADVPYLMEALAALNAWLMRNTLEASRF